MLKCPVNIVGVFEEPFSLRMLPSKSMKCFLLNGGGLYTVNNLFRQPFCSITAPTASGMSVGSSFTTLTPWRSCKITPPPTLPQLLTKKLEYPVNKYISGLSSLFSHAWVKQSMFGGDSRLKTIASRSVKCAFSDLTLTKRIENICSFIGIDIAPGGSVNAESNEKRYLRNYSSIP